MSIKKMTLAEFKRTYRQSGESVAQLAFYAAQSVTDDERFVEAAKALLKAEDDFYKLLLEREESPK